MIRILLTASIILGTASIDNLLAQDSYIISGITVDSLDSSIDFVNIGIIDKNLGTISNDSGRFHLIIPRKFLYDSLTFSIIGYYKKTICISELIHKDELKVVVLPKITTIEEVRVTSRKLKRKSKGNITRLSIGVMGLTSDSANLGREIGTVIHLPKKPVLIKDFNFHIVANRPDSAKLRLNLYRYNNNVIGKNLLNENFYFTVRKEDLGDFKVDLSKYRILASHDIFIAVENVAIYVSDGPDPEIQFDEFYYDRILIPGTVIRGRKSFIRQVSIGNWGETPYSFSPGFWITYLE